MTGKNIHVKQDNVVKRNDLHHVTHLLCTGGWDSTFRLLELMLIKKENIQPVYIVDPDRKSLTYELRAMQQIRSLLKERYQLQYKLLLPTKFFELKDIMPNGIISSAFKRLKIKHPFLGSQNEWLARFTAQYRLKDLEMGLQKSTGANFAAVKDLIKESESNGQSIVAIPEEQSGTDEYLVFGNFSLPLFNITKNEMLKKARASGFDNIMERTWFCHNPLQGGVPCGVCVPCSGVIRDGMAFRMPFYSRVRYRFRIFLSKDQFKKNFPIVYSWLKRIKSAGFIIK